VKHTPNASLTSSIAANHSGADSAALLQTLLQTLLLDLLSALLETGPAAIIMATLPGNRAMQLSDATRKHNFQTCFN